MKGLPESMFLRRGVVRLFLGLSEQEMTKLTETQVLKTKRLTENGRLYYIRESVMEVAGKTKEASK